LLAGQVHQVRVRECGAVDTAQPRHIAVADGVTSRTLPRTASRRLLVGNLVEDQLNVCKASRCAGGNNYSVIALIN
jgi:hypothetical protein